MSVSPSVRMEQLASHWTDFNEVWFLSNFLKCVEKIQLKSDKNSGYFTWRPIYVFDHISLSSYNEKFSTKSIFPPKIVPFVR
jgi:hypothetical protein